MTRKAVVISGSTDLVEAASRAVRESDGWSLAGSAGNGVGGFDLVRAHRPDGVFLDSRMPVFSSLQTLKTIMAYRPHSVAAVSSSAELDGVTLLEMLRCGAGDCYAKPASLDWNSPSARRGLSQALWGAAGRHSVPFGTAQLRPKVPIQCVFSNAPRNVMVISAGFTGFSWVLAVLNALPPDPDLAVLVVGSFDTLHMGVIARYLSRYSTLSTTHMEREFRIEGGQVAVVDHLMDWRLTSLATSRAVIGPAGTERPTVVDVLATEIATSVRGQVGLVMLPGSRPVDVASIEQTPGIRVFRADAPQSLQRAMKSGFGLGTGTPVQAVSTSAASPADDRRSDA
jgi:chemotaxis response regulator CheB